MLAKEEELRSTNPKKFRSESKKKERRGWYLVICYWVHVSFSVLSSYFLGTPLGGRHITSENCHFSDSDIMLEIFCDQFSCLAFIFHV